MCFEIMWLDIPSRYLYPLVGWWCVIRSVFLADTDILMNILSVNR